MSRGFFYVSGILRFVMRYQVILFILLLIFFSGCRRSADNTMKPKHQESVSGFSGGSIGSRALVPAVVADSDNLLMNPGFESGLRGWHWLDWSKGWSAFSLSQEFSYEGMHSLHLPVRSEGDRRSTVVWGGVQELELSEDIPECLDGYFYINNWKRGAWKQYLQVVVIDLSQSLGENAGMPQLRYLVTGEVRPPLSIGNAQYIFEPNHLTESPVMGEWLYLQFNPRRDFQEMWGYVPGSGHKLRVLFEARFDERRGGDAYADVYYDHLYFGPRKSGHCSVH